MVMFKLPDLHSVQRQLRLLHRCTDSLLKERPGLLPPAKHTQLA